MNALATTGYSRFPIVTSIEGDSTFIGYLHIKDVLAQGDDPQAVVDLAIEQPAWSIPSVLETSTSQ